MSNSSLAVNHGHLLGYFTFTDGGVASLSYKISPLLNSTNLMLHIFPMAYDPFTNMQHMRNTYSMNKCIDYYRKSIHTVSVVETEARVPLGRFSGGFSVAIIVSNKYSCSQGIVSFEDEEESYMDLEVNVFNSNQEGTYINHLSGSDLGLKNIFKINLLFFLIIMIMILYSAKYGSNNNVPIMVIIIRVVSVIVICDILICLLIISAYTSFSDTGRLPRVRFLISEVLALLCRYLEIYVILSWTLSSPRNFSQRDVVAQIISLSGLSHILLTIFHYLFIFGNQTSVGCFSVWDCEPHIYSMGWGNPVQYYDTAFGWAAMIINWGSNVVTSLFVLHLLKVGLRTAQLTVRRAYISVFCLASLLWFWSYSAVWVFSALVVDYWQYKMVIFMTNFCQICGLISILRIAYVLPNQIDASPTAVIIY